MKAWEPTADRPATPRHTGSPLLLLLLLLGASCATPATPGLDRARDTIAELAAHIGSRPIGSAEARRARDFIASELALDGFTVRIQDVDAVAPAIGLTAPVSNVIATRDGAIDDAIALVSHYDSVPDGPGAQDDALGVATCLEAARELASGKPLRHSLMVIVTDGEEVGLMGARGVVTDDDVRARVRAFLNFDGTGGVGPPVLFQAGPGRGDTLAAWAHGAAAPFGGSFGVEIYKRLPNDTDFTVLAGAGTSGLNFAPIGDSYVYHTDRDRPAGVADATLAREIDNTVGIVRALDAAPLTRTNDPPTFFDLLERTGVVYGSGVTRAVGIAACAGGVVAWLLLTRALAGAGWRALAGAAARGVAALILPAVVMTAAVWLLRAVRHQPAPWYAAPGWTFGLLAALGCFTLWLIGRVRLGARADDRDPARAPLTVWWCALPLWIAFALFLLLKAPGASYLAAFPLLAAGASVGALVRRRPAWVRLSSAVVLAIALTLWAHDLVVLLGFLVPLFGWLPIATPVWLYPAVLVVGGVMLLPPMFAAASGTAAVRRLSTAIGLVCALAVVGFAGGALASPAYTDEHPARRAVRYLEDDVHRHAWWSVAGSDAGIASSEPPASGATWSRPSGPVVVPPVTVAGLGLPVELRADVLPMTSRPPADIHATTYEEDDGRVTVQVMVAPHSLLSARLILPRGLTPTHSNYAGVMDRGQWTAAYIAVPREDFAFRVQFAPGFSHDAIEGATVVLTMAGVPAADGKVGPALPSWLPAGPATWQARSTFVLPVKIEDE